MASNDANVQSSSMKFQPRRYYCIDPVNSDCRKGFISAAGMTRHQNAVHKHYARRPSHSQQCKAGTSSDRNENMEHPKGAYYLKHPILDGRYFYPQ